MCVTVNTHPPISKTRIPASVQSVTFNIPTSPTHVASLTSKTSKSGSKTPKSDQIKCHAPFSAREHVGSIMSNMSCHVIMSCHVVTLETDPCVGHCQYSPTHVKDQNPCLCAKCHFQHSYPPYSCSVYDVKVWLENAQNPTKHSATPPFQPASMSVSSKSGSKTP